MKPTPDFALADAVLVLCRHVGRAQQAAFRRAAPGDGEPKPDGSLRSAIDVESEQVLRAGLGVILPEAGCLGCAALELSYVAAGHLQGFWEVGLDGWDTAAASVLLTETGCRIADGRGAPYRPLESAGILAGHPGVFEALLDIVADAGTQGGER